MGSPKENLARTLSMATLLVLSLSVFLFRETTTGTTIPSQSSSIIQCGYKHFWANDQKTITYDRLITDHMLGDYYGNFDLEAGTFTAGMYVWYSFDYSSSVPYNSLNDYIEVYLWLNGVEVPESRFWTTTSSSNTPGWFLEDGSCKMTLQLKEGDRVQLYGDYQHNALNHFVFCVTML